MSAGEPITKEKVCHEMWREIGEPEGYECPWCEIERLTTERDHYRLAAEINLDTIKEMQHQRDSVHDELVHLQNAPRSFR